MGDPPKFEEDWRKEYAEGCGYEVLLLLLYVYIN
jgi:hypothetical protein